MEDKIVASNAYGSSVQIKEEPTDYYDDNQNNIPGGAGIKAEEAEFIANSLYIDIDYSPKNNTDDFVETDNAKDSSISDHSSHSDDGFSQRMKLKARFGSGFDQNTISNVNNGGARELGFIGVNPTLTDFSCPIKDPDEKKISDDEDTETDPFLSDNESESSGEDVDTSDEDYVPDENLSVSSSDDIIYENPLPKRKVFNTRHSKKLLSNIPTGSSETVNKESVSNVSNFSNATGTTSGVSQTNLNNSKSCTFFFYLDIIIYIQENLKRFC